MVVLKFHCKKFTNFMKFDGFALLGFVVCRVIFHIFLLLFFVLIYYRLIFHCVCTVVHFTGMFIPSRSFDALVCFLS